MMKLYFTLLAIEKIAGYIVLAMFVLFWVLIIWINKRY